MCDLLVIAVFYFKWWGFNRFDFFFLNIIILKCNYQGKYVNIFITTIVLFIYLLYFVIPPLTWSFLHLLPQLLNSILLFQQVPFLWNKELYWVNTSTTEEQRHGHWFSTTICMESSKSVVDGPFDESYINISAMTWIICLKSSPDGNCHTSAICTWHFYGIL